MSTAFHGTKADNLKSILTNGIRGDQDANWVVSANNVYCWHTDHVEGDTAEDRRNEAFRLAAESAEFCLWDSIDCRRIILEVDLSDYEPDDSCDNMAESGAVQTSEIHPSQIKAIYIDSEDLSFYKAYFAGMRLDREMAEDIDLTPSQSAMAKTIANSDVSIEIFEYLSDLVWYMKTVDMMAVV